MAAIAPSPKPFFVFWAPRVAHSPLEVPEHQLDHFSFIEDSSRRYYHAMVYFIDEAIGNVTRELKANGQWKNTLIVLHADNVSPPDPPTSTHTHTRTYLSLLVDSATMHTGLLVPGYFVHHLFTISLHVDFCVCSPCPPTQPPS